jgi:hypothetical protein
MKYTRIAAFILVLIISALVAQQTVSVIRQNRDLLKLRETESSFQEDLQKLKDTQVAEADVLKKSALKFYTPQRLYTLYTSLDRELPGTFVSMALSPDYTVDGGITWFTVTITEKNVCPVCLLDILQKEVPPLQIVSFSESPLQMTVTCRGMIITNDKSFIITPELLNIPRYTVATLIGTTTSSQVLNLYPSPQYVRAQYNSLWYFGTVKKAHLDLTTAEAMAESSPEPVFIVKEQP